ncbi:uncharacterized protein LOC113861042 [Abrus precatorius]|uniref:Uncharacterized protein LOC113861042 n=1 Tax=Abrus precatorius TaxID=3816 RepID=A0A8B8KZV0_ABRPR|nr:uncharacterized protein LOC113861042 [Abrus precatorius]
MFGRPPPSIPQLLLNDTSNATVQFELSNREEILRKHHTNLHKAELAMKRWADSNHRDLQFAVDDWVYVLLHPRRQISPTGGRFSKLYKRYFSPFKITQKIKEVAYKLDLPPAAKIHNVLPLKTSSRTVPSSTFSPTS